MRSPDEHYAEAERLLDSVADERDAQLPYVAFRLAQANIHALLAQCPPDYADDYDPTYRPVSVTTPTLKEGLL